MSEEYVGILYYRVGIEAADPNRKRLTIFNTFHDTQIDITPKAKTWRYPDKLILTLSRQQTKKIRDALCPVGIGCECKVHAPRFELDSLRDKSNLQMVIEVPIELYAIACKNLQT